MLARAIADARKAIGLSHEQFAALLDLEPSTVRAWESGKSPIAPAQLDMVARLFGLDAAQFLGADLRKTPSTLLYRSMAQGAALERFAGDRLPHQLGEFLYCVRIVAECERLAGKSSAGLAWLDDVGPEPLPAVSSVPHGADELAVRVRNRLGLGIEPIPSMRALLRELEIEVFFTDPDNLHPSVDAACALHPRPAILVNVLAGGDAWWHTRMSLAHELAHLCFDRDVLGAPRRLFLFSPVERRSWQLVDRFEALEQRAKAFAAYFQAPPALVEKLIPREAAASPESLHRLRAVCGVGHETAANLLKNVFGLSDVQRNALLAAPRSTPAADHPDRVVAPKMRDDAFVARVLGLLRAGAIDEIRARRWLRIGAHEPLPSGHDLSEAQRAPVLTGLDRVRLRVDFLLRCVLADASLHVERVEPTEAGVAVARVIRMPGAEPVGDVIVRADDLAVVRVSDPRLARLVAA